MKNKNLYIYLILSFFLFNVSAGYITNEINYSKQFQCIPFLNKKYEIYFQDLESINKKIVDVDILTVENNLISYLYKKIFSSKFEKLYYKNSIKLLQFNNFYDYFNSELKNFSSMAVVSKNLRNIKIKLENDNIIKLYSTQSKENTTNVHILNLNKFKDNIKNIYFNYDVIPGNFFKKKKFPFIFLNYEFHDLNYINFNKKLNYKNDIYTKNCLKFIFNKKENKLPIPNYTYSIKLND